jgi:Protein kinase domain/WD domain, G-beta repeat
MAETCGRCGTAVGLSVPGGFADLCPRCVLASVVEVDEGEVMAPPPPARSAASAEQEVSGELGGYAILRVLGAGGMGTVYLASQPGLGREVALKVLDPPYDAGLLRRFHTEARALARLHHPHVVEVYEVAEAGGLHFYSMELLEAGTLAGELESGPLSPRRAAELLRQVALGVHHAHQAGIVHRDLKPANVLLDAAGAPKVADFGLARDHRSRGNETSVGVALGTGPYMAPEQARGELDRIGPAADVWALGAILFECLSGTPPFPGGHLSEVLQRLDEPPPSVGADLPAALDMVCRRALQPDPAARHPSAWALAQELEAWLERGESPVRRGPGWLRGWRRDAALLVGGGVMVLAAVLALSPRRGGRKPEPQRRPAETEGETPPRADAPTPDQPVSSSLAGYQAILATPHTRLNGVWGLEDGHRGPITALLAMQDGVLSGGADGTLRGWKAGGQRELASGPGVTDVALGPASDRLVWGESDGSVRLLKDDRLRLLGRHRSPVLAVRVIEGGQQAISLSADGGLGWWDVERVHIGPLRSRELGVACTAADVSADGRYLLVAGEDQRLHAFDLLEGSSLGSTAPGSARVTALALLGGGLALAGHADGALWLWDMRENRSRVLPGHTQAVTSIVVSQRRRAAATAARDGKVLLWELERVRLTDAIDLGPGRDRPNKLALGRDERSLLVGTAAGVLLGFELRE